MKLDDWKNIAEIAAFFGGTLWFLVQLLSGHFNHNLKLALNEQRSVLPDGRDISRLNIVFEKGSNGRVLISDIAVTAEALTSAGFSLLEDCSIDIGNSMREAIVQNGKIRTESGKREVNKASSVYFVPGDGAAYGCMSICASDVVVRWQVTVIGTRMFGSFRYPALRLAQWTSSIVSAPSGRTTPAGSR